MPELSDLKRLQKATITKALAGRSQTNVNKVRPLHRVTWRLRSPIDAFLIVIQTWYHLQVPSSAYARVKGTHLSLQ